MFINMKQVNDFFESRQQFGIQPGLKRIEKILFLLGNPQNNIKTIHIAGTNGKGSTINFLKTALIDNNYQVGVFTSPSMTDLTGHIYLNNESIPQKRFIEILNTMLPFIDEMDQEGLHITEFEILTAVAFVYFDKMVDIALIEAGMGGRGDTTNCIRPLISIITSVELDHTAFLGTTIEEVAYQKAGIIKDNIPVIIGNMQSSAVEVMMKEVEYRHSNLYQVGKDFEALNILFKEKGQSYQWSDNEHSLSINLIMEGKHQVENSSIALKTLLLLINQGFHIEIDVILESFNKTQLAGRFEQVLNHPLIILDGAHNPAGMKSFVDLAAKKYHDSIKTLIFGAFKDKEIKKMIELVSPEFEHIILTPFEHPRAANMELLKTYADDSSAVVIQGWKYYIKKLLNNPAEPNHVYFIAGSMNFITQVRHMILSDNR